VVSSISYDFRVECEYENKLSYYITHYKDGFMDVWKKGDNSCFTKQQMYTNACNSVVRSNVTQSKKKTKYTDYVFYLIMMFYQTIMIKNNSN